MGTGGGRIVAVDVGTRKVGIAIADPLGLFAQPVGAFPPNEAIDVLKRIHEESVISVAVVGWPLDEDGREGPATRMVNVYVRRIRKAVRGVRIVRLDEGFTSEEARGRLGAGAVGGRVDTLAAGLILQEYLDGERGNVSAGSG